MRKRKILTHGQIETNKQTSTRQKMAVISAFEEAIESGRAKMVPQSETKWRSTGMMRALCSKSIDWLFCCSINGNASEK